MNKEQKEQLGDLFIALVKTIGAFAVLGISVAFGGYVVKYLWNGIIPQTFGLNPLTWAQATGLDTLISFIVLNRSKSKTDETMLKIVIDVVLINLIYMLIGWVVMQFI